MVVVNLVLHLQLSGSNRPYAVFWTSIGHEITKSTEGNSGNTTCSLTLLWVGLKL